MTSGRRKVAELLGTGNVREVTGEGRCEWCCFELFTDSKLSRGFAGGKSSLGRDWEERFGSRLVKTEFRRGGKSSSRVGDANVTGLFNSVMREKCVNTSFF